MKQHSIVKGPLATFCLSACAALFTCAAAVAAEDAPRIAVSNAAGQNLELIAKPLSWGKDWYGEATLPRDLGDMIAYAGGGQHSVALRRDGTVIAWGDETYAVPAFAKRLTKAKAIAAGDAWTVALKQDGTLVFWGGDVPEVRSGVGGVTNVQAIAAGQNHLVILKKDGTVITRGNNQSNQLATPPGLKGVKAIAAGGAHSLALKQDGTVVAWGDNGRGQCNVPPGLTGVRQIAGGGTTSLALKEDGTVVVWGYAVSGQAAALAGLRDVRSIAAAYTRCAALKNDGSLVVWGPDRYGENYPLPSAGPLPRLDAVWLTFFHSVALSRSTAPQSLGAQIVGTSATTSFSFKNTGTAALTLGAITATGDDPGDFIIGSPAATTLAAGASTTLSVNFAPTAIGDRTAILHIASNDAAQTVFDIPITGSGVCPQITIVTPSAAPALVNQPFSRAFTSRGGIGPMHFSIYYGGVPGLKLSADGVFSGTPTMPGFYPCTIIATDTLGCRSYVYYNISVADSISNEDEPSQIVPFTVPPNSSVAASSSNRFYVPNSSIIIGGSSTERTLSFTPKSNVNGFVTITLTITNSSGTTTRAITFAIASVNDAPVATLPQIGGTITASPAHVSTRENFSDVDGHVITYSAVADRPDALGEDWGINTNGILSLSTPPSGTTGGEVLITVTATDEGGLSASSVVKFNVANATPPVVTPPATAPVLNRRTGLFEWLVNVRNTGSFPITGYDLLISGLPANWQVWNAAANKPAPRNDEGQWIVHHGVAVPGGSNLTQVVTFFNPTRAAAAIKPAIRSFIVPTGKAPAASTAATPVNLGQDTNGAYLIFDTVPGEHYQIYYRAADGNWVAATPALFYASGSSSVWIDAANPEPAPLREYLIDLITP